MNNNNNKNMQLQNNNDEEKKTSIAFFATYRPPVPLALYSCPYPSIKLNGHVNGRTCSTIDDFDHSETHMTDDKESYDYNGQFVEPETLMLILEQPVLKRITIKNEVDVAAGGILFVSERGIDDKHDEGLELLYIAIRLKSLVQNCEGSRNVKVYRLSEIYPEMGDCVRMEDKGCIAGEYLIFVSTKEQPLDGKQVPIRRQPWTAVYKTHLRTGKTERLTPQGVADINPAVSPDGKKIAVASFQGRKEEKGWDGEIENLETNIFIMDIDNPNERLKIQSNCGWPTWGSNNVVFYHSEFMYSRDIRTGTATFHWGVFRVELGNKGVVSEPTLVTSQDIFKAITPVAIDANTVVVATIRRKSEFSDVREEDQYRHIEVFSTTNKEGIKITQQSNDHKLADHYNPFMVVAVNQHGDKEKRIGYHRTRRDHYSPDGGDLTTRVDKLESTNAKVELFRVPGVFPSFSKCGKKLAYVDNNFKSVWVMSETCLAPTCVYETDKSVFCPIWNQSADKDILYVCYGPAFTFKEEVHILAINCERDREFGFRKNDTKPSQLTSQFNNAFPSTSPDGARIVYRSTRDFHDKEKKHKNLYIMDAEKGEKGPGFMRLTIGEFDDTHCEWSPNGDWIVFSSSRDRPPFAKDDNGLDAGYFAVYIVRPDNPNVVVKVAGSGANNIGHMNHPFFSPDMTSIVVTADLAAVSCDPLSLPLFIHSVRPYGDIFIIDIDEELLSIKTKEDAAKFQGVKNFKRMTHSKYENSTACWTGDNTLLRKEWEKSRKSSRSTTQAYFITMLNADISIDMDILDSMKSKRQRLNLPSIPACPYLNRAENWHMTGHLNLPDRLC